MSETTDEVTDLEARVLAHVRANDELGIREVFNEVDMSDMKSNVYEFELPVDGEPTEPIPEGERMPRKGTEHRKKTVRFDKFGFEVTDEVDDEDIEDQVEMLNATLASQAASEIYDNVRVSWESSERLDIVETAIKEAGSTVTYSDQDVVVVSQILGESIADDDPTRDWDEIRADFADEYSIDVVTDQYNVLRGADVLVADTDYLGYEATRQYPEVDSYVEYEDHDMTRQNYVPEDERVVKNEVARVFTRKGFVVMSDDAGHVVRFGRI